MPFASWLPRILIFLLARAAPAATVLLVAIVYRLRDGSVDYLIFSVGFAVAALSQSLLGGWWSHWLVRTDPLEHHGVKALRRLQAAIIVGGAVAAASAGAVALKVVSGTDADVRLGAIATAVCAVQMALGAMLVSRHQYLMSHGRLLFAELARAGGGFAGAAIAVGANASGEIALLAYSGGALCGVAGFAPKSLPGFGGGLEDAAEAGRALPIAGEAARYGLPIVAVTASFLVIQFSDRVLLSVMASQEIAGLYAAAYDLINRPIALALAAISLASQRAMFAAVDRTNTIASGDSILRRDLILQGVVSLLAAALMAGFLGFSPSVRDLVLGDLAVIVAPLALSAAVVLALTHTLMRPLQALRRTTLIGQFAVVAAVVNLVANLTLIPVFGAAGAALATLIAAVAFAAALLRATSLLSTSAQAAG